MSFQDDLNRAKVNILNNMAKTVRGGAIQAFNTIIIESPVDTGRFRGNWQCSLNYPVLTTLFDDVKGSISTTENVSAKTQGYTLDDVMYLTNNLPYAEALENGHSKQRGSGWVAKTVAVAKLAIQSNLDKIS